jgi:predicted Fe-Mo cluster-binding NifX family protein
MGQGAYEGLRGYGIRPIVTDVGDIREAVGRYLEGNLPDLSERLH